MPDPKLNFTRAEYAARLDKTRREMQARERDLPRKWLLKDDVMVELCRRLPRNMEALSKIRGMEAGLIRREGKLHFQEYANGKPASEFKAIGQTDRTGTKVTFHPNPEIFKETEFSFDTLSQRFRELSYLNSGLTIKIVDERGEGDEQREEIFHYEGGISSFVENLTAKRKPLHDTVVAFTDTRDGIEVDVAMRWTEAYSEQITCFTNTIKNRDGGTHLTGFRQALTRTVNSYAQTEKVVRDLKKQFDVKLNDVVLALTSSALRRWLRHQDALPDKPAVAMCPVSTRGEEQGLGNQVTNMAVSLATHLDDPVDRLPRKHCRQQAEQH